MAVLKQGLIQIPNITAANQKKDSKAWIVYILSKEWPLTAKEIYKRMQTQNGSAITYQAIHKAIRLLTIDGVINRVHSKYSLNPDWIDNLRKFGDELKASFNGRRYVHLQEINEKTSIQVVFNSFIEYFYWLMDELIDFSHNNMEDNSTFSITYHPWPITHISKNQYEKFKQFHSDGSHYLACKGNSIMDKTLLEMWKSVGRKVKPRAECSKNCDILVYGDFVIQLFLPSSTKKSLNRIFDSFDKVNPKKFSELYRIFYDNCEPVNVLITRNPDLSSQLKNEVLMEFK